MIERNDAVLVVVQALEGGGAEQVAANWIRVLSAMGYSLQVAVLAAREKSSDRPLLGANVTVHYIAPRGTLHQIRSVRSLIRSANITHTISLLTHPNLIALAATAGTKHSLTISEHNVPSILLSSQSLRHKVQRLGAKVMYARAHSVIAVSHAVATDLIVNYGVRRRALYVLPNQVLNSRDSNRVVAPPAQLQLLIPARITWQKRPELVISVAEELVRRGYGVEVQFVGDLRDGYPLSKLRSDSVNVRVRPWAGNWASEAAPNSIVLVPSAVEGLGNIFIEAAASKLRVVTGSSALGVADAVIDGVTGTLAANDSVASYADAVERASAAEFGDLQGWFDRFRPTATRLVLETIMTDARR